MPGENHAGARSSSRNAQYLEVGVEILTLLGVVALQLVRLPLTDILAQIDPWPTPFADFIAHFWETGRHPQEPSHGFYYSAFAAILFMPFAYFDVNVALVLWNACQVAFLVGLFFVGRQFVRDAPLSIRLFHAAALGMSLSLWHNFKWGQVSAGLSLLLLGALMVFDTGRHRLAACLLAMAIAIKGYPAMTIVPFLALRRTKAILTGLGVFLFCAVVLPILVLGPSDALAVQRLTSSRARLALDSWVIGNGNAQYALSVFGRWFDAPRGTWGSSTASLAASLAGGTLALVGMRLVHLVRLPIERVGAWTAALLLPSLPFIVPTCWPHYFIFLPAIQAFVAAESLRSTLPKFARMTLVGLCVASMLLTSSFACWTMEYANFVNRGMPFVGSMLVLVAALVVAEGKMSPRA